jgi:hypothetical protein
MIMMDSIIMYVKEIDQRAIIAVFQHNKSYG